MLVKVNWVLVYVFQNLPFCSVHHDADVIFAYVISHEWKAFPWFWHNVLVKKGLMMIKKPLVRPDNVFLFPNAYHGWFLKCNIDKQAHEFLLWCEAWNWRTFSWLFSNMSAEKTMLTTPSEDDNTISFTEKNGCFPGTKKKKRKTAEQVVY